MTRYKYAILLLLFTFMPVFSQDEIEYTDQLYLNFLFDPFIESMDFNRGLSISYSKKIINPLFLGLSGKFLNMNYNSLSLLLTYSPSFFRFSIPLNAGIGVNLYDIDFSDLNIFYEVSSGLEFIVNYSLAYGLKAIYLKDILNNKDDKLLVELGVKYFF